MSKNNREFSYKVLQQSNAIGFGLFHLFFLIMFAVYKVYFMAGVNCISVLCYIYAYKIAEEKNQVKFFKVVYWEVVIHAVLAIIVVGNNCGFIFYFLCIIPITVYTKFAVSHINETLKEGEKLYINDKFYIIVDVLALFAMELHTLFKTGPIVEFGTTGLRQFFHGLNIMVVAFYLVQLSYILLNNIFELQHILKKKNERLKDMANNDELTNLYNRRFFDEEITKMIKTQKIYSIIMCDIDDFKIINDTHGHEFGDVVLKKISTLLVSTLRDKDLVCRWGGEEIVVFLPETDKLEAEALAERVRKIINIMDFVNRDEIITASLTLGVADSSERDNPTDVINLADERLYYGKNNGKNIVVSGID